MYSRKKTAGQLLAAPLPGLISAIEYLFMKLLVYSLNLSRLEISELFRSE